jgi:phosphoglycolate phosphatase
VPVAARGRRGAATPGPSPGCTSLYAGQALHGPTQEDAIHRLVLWNIDLTLVDVARVTREAYAEAFAAVAGRPLIRLPQMAGRSESEIFFDALALNGIDVRAGGEAERLLDPFSAELAAALRARRDDLVTAGQLLPGAAEAVAAVARLDGVVQTVLTGNGKANATLKLRAFALDGYLDLDIGGYGSEAYPRGTLLRVARQRASEKHGVTFGERATVYVADSSRDVAAARIGGASSLAVASGRASSGELREAGADAVLPDLTDTSAVVTVITRLTGPPATPAPGHPDLVRGIIREPPPNPLQL